MGSTAPEHGTMIKHILVVDPAAAVLAAYKRQYETQGVRIDACETYGEAIELLKTRSYDVALMDAWQAGVRQKNALELLRLLRERRPDVKLILMTRGGNNDAEKKAREMGASFYFDKPVFSSTILKALKELGVTK
jgi:CheY-like chemotaxis protein